METKSNWGDCFRAEVPDVIKRPDGCNCDRLRNLMNQCDSQEADTMFDKFSEAIYENASETWLSRLPKPAVMIEVKRRLNKAYLLAFGFKRGR